MTSALPTIVIDNDDELRTAFERTLRSQGLAVVGKQADTNEPSETVRLLFELPSNLALLEPIVDYVTKRVELVWSMPAERCIRLGLALRESLINAIMHGSQNDESKVIRITAEVSNDEARFVIEDEGPGFKTEDVPNPSDHENLFKSCGRGVLFIRSIMDETEYNDRGNRLTMIMKRTSPFEAKPI